MRNFDFGYFRVLFFLKLFYNSIESLLTVTLLQKGTHLSETFQKGFFVRFLDFVQKFDFRLYLENWVSKSDWGENKSGSVKILVKSCNNSKLQQKLAHMKIFESLFCQHEFFFEVLFLDPFVAHCIEQIESCCVSQVEP